MLSREDCKKRFEAECNLQMITDTQIQRLKEFLKEELYRHYLEGGTNARRMDMTIAKQYKRDAKYSDGNILFLYININSSYFKNREGISFHPNGELGFCNWADKNNCIPVLQAFDRWLNYLATEERREKNKYEKERKKECEKSPQ